MESLAIDDHRCVAISPWYENQEGDALVITDWVPSQNGLTAEETIAWHRLREEQAITNSNESGRA